MCVWRKFPADLLSLGPGKLGKNLTSYLASIRSENAKKCVSRVPGPNLRPTNSPSRIHVDNRYISICLDIDIVK